MKKHITFALLLFSTLGAFAQVTKEDLEKELKPLTQKVNSLQSENSKLKSEIGTLNSKLSNAYKSIDSLRTKTQDNSNAITQTANQLGIQIKETGDKNEGKITEVSQSLSKNSLYGIIGVLSAILLSGILYWLLSKKQKKDRSDVTDMLARSRENLLEQIKENSNSIGINFLRELNEYSDLVALQFQSKQSTPNAETDHSLALKVANEINLIERNINLMDSKTKGLKGLQVSVGKLKDNLSANGYEIPELLGKQFHQGMKVIVTSSIPDENLEKGSEIISKILIPQVNYNDKMIQTAQIEVSVGY